MAQLPTHYFQVAYCSPPYDPSSLLPPPTCVSPPAARRRAAEAQLPRSLLPGSLLPPTYLRVTPSGSSSWMMAQLPPLTTSG